MLYNESTGKPGVYTLQGFIGWLEQQPANGTYCYMTPGNCAVAQYLESFVSSDGMTS